MVPLKSYSSPFAAKDQWTKWLPVAVGIFDGFGIIEPCLKLTSGKLPAPIPKLKLKQYF